VDATPERCYVKEKVRRGRAGDRDGDRSVGLQQVPDAAGDVALEAAQRFAASLALGLLAGEVGDGVEVAAALGDGDAVQRPVELAVAYRPRSRS
jgi:hypothetical protein